VLASLLVDSGQSFFLFPLGKVGTCRFIGNDFDNVFGDRFEVADGCAC
jgi:hypothetical protein